MSLADETDKEDQCVYSWNTMQPLKGNEMAILHNRMSLRLSSSELESDEEDKLR